MVESSSTSSFSTDNSGEDHDDSNPRPDFGRDSQSTIPEPFYYKSSCLVEGLEVKDPFKKMMQGEAQGSELVGI